MAKRRTASPAASAVSLDRAIRLFRLLALLSKATQTRTVLTRKLRLNVRGFYRDLEVLREAGIMVELSNGRYRLVDEPAQAIERLPFPDPGLNLGDARLLSRGRSRAHKKIRELLEMIER